jgi:cell wall-associated NlpC family hydrolase
LSVYRSRARRGRLRRPGALTPSQTGAAVAAGLALAWYAHGTTAGHGHAAVTAAATAERSGGAALTTRGAPDRAAATAIGYARDQLGKPYLWGGTGPGAYDCSGLVYEAYLAAGVAGIPRTSQTQWAWGPQVTTPTAGDLVFFAGGDGTPASPGHVGIVIDPARHLMIEAYATGYPIRIAVYGLPGAAPGDQVVVGFTAPQLRTGVS